MRKKTSNKLTYRQTINALATSTCHRKYFSNVDDVIRQMNVTPCINIHTQTHTEKGKIHREGFFIAH